jgi:hypothetical protein
MEDNLDAVLRVDEGTTDPKHRVMITVETADVPDLKKIYNAAVRLGNVTAISYSKYDW